MKKNVYVYPHAGALYVNLTNRCTNNCVFCLRNNTDGIDGTDLWLEREPTAAEVIADLKEMEGISEVVFCGFGEPTIKLDELLEVAKYVKQKGKKTRLNTNGHASAFHHRDVPRALRGLIDTVSISLNAVTKERYQKLCHSVYGEEGFENMLEFARRCVEEGIHTVLSVVDIIGAEEIEEARKLTEKIGANFRVRKYIG